MSAYDQLQVSLGKARSAREEEETRKQLAYQAGSSLYGAWTDTQNLKMKQLLGEKATIGKKEIPMYEDQGNFFKNLFTPAEGRVGVNPEYQKHLNIKKYAEGAKDNPWMTATKPDEPMNIFKDPVYGTFQDDTPLTAEDWDFFHGSDVLDAEGLETAQKGLGGDYLNLKEPTLGQAGAGSGFGSDLFSKIKSGVGELAKGVPHKGITNYKFGAGGADLTSIGTTPATANVLGKAGEVAGQIGNVAGKVGDVLGPVGSAVGLATTDTAALMGAKGQTAAAKTASGAAGNIFGIASAVPGPHQPFTAAASLLFGAGSV